VSISKALRQIGRLRVFFSRKYGMIASSATADETGRWPGEQNYEKENYQPLHMRGTVRDHRDRVHGMRRLQLEGE